MALNIKSFTQLVQDQITAVQSYYSGLIDTAIGSHLLALVESNSSVVQWIQQNILNLLVTTRASTCSGSDLDSWLADYSFYRLSAVQATGQVTFSRFTATNQALIPVGTVVTTTDGSQSYAVITDTTNSAYDATQLGYIIAAGIASVTVPIQANTAGVAANATAGTISIINGGITYVDTVNNANPLSNGEDQESDDAVRARFVLWIASLSKSTKAAIIYAITSMQSGVTCTLTENYDYSGNQKPGYFYAVVNDGSGSPSSGFLASVASAIDAVRGFTITFGVFSPVIVTANVSMVITTNPAATHSDIVTFVQTAIQNYISKLTLGQLLPYTQLATIAYGASSYVTNVSSVTLNGATADISASAQQVIAAGTISVS